MILYHGSYTQSGIPKIIVQEKGRDFGFGFYTTSIKNQAERWAIRTARLRSRHSDTTENAVVNLYEFDEEYARTLRTKSFPDADLEWLELVINCRSHLNYRHDYDIISGKIANDNVGETIEYVLAGIMRKEDAVERLRFEKINEQICFCTEESLKAIAFKESYVVKNVFWRDI
ncbi:MAG: DUF3990 domain-containing protein [Treponema sp.]|nr:DUF3990 domain-containing protein [Treponema sp.]